MDQQVTRLLALSKVDEALSLLEAQAKADTEQAQSHWRRLGRLAYNINTPQALRAYENVVALGSEQIWDAVYLARLQQRSGDLAASHTTIDNALQRFPVPDGRNASREKLRDVSVLYSELGDIRTALGDLSWAEGSYRADLAIAKSLAEQDPGNVDWQRDLSISFERLGDLKEDRQDIPAAIDFYRKSLPVAKQLADKFPTHPQFVRDVQITERRLAELEQRE